MSRPKVKRLVAAARGLACVLAGLLLLVEVLGPNGSFHQSLHSNGNGTPGSCLLCLFAKGQVDMSQPVVVPPAQLPIRPDQATIRESIVFPAFSFLVFPSRAPPAPAPLPPAVA